MEKQLSDQLRYLTISAIDEEWGIVVTTVGYQFIPPKGNYPLSKHPDNYNFKPQTGRILNEYQLVYITKGSGY
ncbi:MAG: AraC family transcriptional regulator, partial [Parabacteroides sp.]|nr:AraC family transcriptional regulator [Parabacteroides sp.]